MDYDNEFLEIRNDSNTLALDTRRFTWTLHRTAATTTKRVVGARFESLKTQNEAIRRLPRSEQDRIQRELLEEESAARQLAASVARHRVEPKVEALAKRLQTYIDTRRADTMLTFPEALVGFDGPAMVALAQYREMRRSTVEGLTAAELLRLAQSALASRDAVGYVDFQLIERRVARGGLSQTSDDVPIAKQLAEFVEGIVDLRVEPFKPLGVVRDNIREAQKVVSRADLVQVLPIDAEHHPTAKAAFEQAEEEFEAEAQAAGQ
jgi:hypothetical protein